MMLPEQHVFVVVVDMAPSKLMGETSESLVEIFEILFRHKRYSVGLLFHFDPHQVKCRLLNYDIFLKEFLTYFGKCHKLIYDISQNLLEIHSKICRNLKIDINLSWTFDKDF